MFSNFSVLARRVTRLADSIPLPTRRRTTGSVGGTKPLGPALVRGRGLARRRPRHAARLLAWAAWLLLGAAFLLLVLTLFA